MINKYGHSQTTGVHGVDSLSTPITGMVGDVNLFLNDADDPTMAEIEVSHFKAQTQNKSSTFKVPGHLVVMDLAVAIGLT